MPFILVLLVRKVFFDLGVDMARRTLVGLDADYTMSVDIALPA